MKDCYCQSNGEWEGLCVQVSLSQDNTKSKGPNQGVHLIMHSLAGSSDIIYGEKRGSDGKRYKIVNKHKQENLQHMVSQRSHFSTQNQANT